MSTIIVKGKLIELKRTVKRFDNGEESKEKLFVSLADVELTEEQEAEFEKAFEKTSKKLTPVWVKDFNGYVNVSTTFELPAILPNGKEVLSIEDEVTDGFRPIGADVKLSLNVKSGAIYPKALKFINEGKELNPFEGLDEEDLPINK